MKMKFLKLYIIISLIIIEGFSFLLLKNTKNERILKILEKDSELFWIQKKNIKTKFEGVTIITNSYGFREKEILKKSKKRILIMGASPAFGWGIEKDKRYSDILQKKLTQKYEVINGSVIGYSSYQGKILFSKIVDKIQPNIVIFDYGINDADRYRFFLNNGKKDSETRPNFFYKYLFIPNSVKLITHILLKYNILTPYISTKQRVSMKEFLENITYFYELSLKFKFKLMILTSPFFYPENCYNYTTIDENKLKEKKYVEKNFKSKYKSINLSNKIYEIQSCKVIDDINKLNEIKKSLKLSNVILIDIASLINNNSKMFLKPDTDFVHLSEKAHYIIAEEIEKFIE